MRTNQRSKNSIKTHEGASGRRITSLMEFKRTLLSCMLFEKNFYENGISVSERLANLVPSISIEELKVLTIQARTDYKLRHAPLFVAKEALKIKQSGFGEVITEIIQRPDELSEIVAMYWKGKKTPLAKQLKLGLANAFVKFDEYQLAKYNSMPRDIKLRDVLFMCHAKPSSEEQALLWKRLINNELETPDTWEVALSSGADKKASWERLIKTRKLGGLAFLRNLRNMTQAGVDRQLIKDGLSNLNVSKVLPFRFVSAARHAAAFEPELEKLLFRSIENYPKIEDETVFLIDVSGSMDAYLSRNSEVDRLAAANGIAMIGREVFTNSSVYSFSNATKEVPPRRGFALAEAITKSQSHGGTYLGQAVQIVLKKHPKMKRLIVVTDEQSHDPVATNIGCRGYLINVAPYKTGVGYGGNWVNISGFSEKVIDYMIEYEKEF